jgi:inorganic pyrophosphatase
MCPIGVANMSDEEQNDDRVLCVMLDDPVYAPYELSILCLNTSKTS